MENEREAYEAPELEVIEFDAEDVIVTSCTSNNQTEMGA